MKKLVAALLSLVMLFSLAACGSDASPANDSPVNDSPVSAEATAEPVVEPQPEEVAESTYYGTWKAVSCAQNGITVSVETLEKNDFYLISHSDLILREDGKFYLNILYKETTGEWETTETGIHASEQRYHDRQQHESRVQQQDQPYISQYDVQPHGATVFICSDRSATRSAPSVCIPRLFPR